jgi:hypothetical protein
VYGDDNWMDQIGLDLNLLDRISRKKSGHVELIYFGLDHIMLDLN